MWISCTVVCEKFKPIFVGFTFHVRANSSLPIGLVSEASVKRQSTAANDSNQQTQWHTEQNQKTNRKLVEFSNDFNPTAGWCLFEVI